jgi:hypothetical protein
MLTELYSVWPLLLLLWLLGFACPVAAVVMVATAVVMVVVMAVAPAMAAA